MKLYFFRKSFFNSNTTSDQQGLSPLQPLKSKKGQGLIEYLIIVALITVSAMGIMRVMGQTVQAKFAKVTQALQGGNNTVDVRVDAVEEQHFKKKDMNDFFYRTRRYDDQQR